ncbi:MAG: FAD-dependent oxidoreductase [Lachnospiraceae bacterium]|nr:FAD-dependent oxidoreductase [Lachnospiraceae bacterium]
MAGKKFKGKELYPHLFSPLRLGNVRMKNRIICAPTSPSMITLEGHMTPEMIAYLEKKAMGGAAVVTYGESIVHSTTGKQHDKQLQLDSYGVRQGLTQTAWAIHNAGAYANTQLSHGGMYSGLSSVGGTIDKSGKAWGVSDMDMPQGHVSEMPREMIYEIIESYGKGAKLCKDCGFDMVQIHAAHGWLFSQFLSPAWNKRTDEFGGSLENRARFFLLSVEAVRKACGPMFPIEVRISGDDFLEGGLTQKDCIEVAKMVDGKCDLINVSCGNHEDPTMFQRTHPCSFYPHGVNVYLAAEVKKHVKTPVACVGAIQDPAHMEEIIATGQADVIEIARESLADPYLPQKALEGKAEDITPCLRCYECFGGIEPQEMVRCAVNPVIGQEQQARFGVKPAEVVKDILVVGGGPAGMEAAFVAAERGHRVTLAEAKNTLGGNLLPAGAASFKQEYRQFAKVLEERIRKAGVRIELNTEVTPEYIQEKNPDALFIAIGSKELKPPIKGLDGENVIMAIDAELNPKKLGKNVVIMGGGLVGAEGAVSFHEEGHDVTLVEMKSELATESTHFYRDGLLVRVYDSAKVMCNTTVKEVRPNGVLVTDEKGEERLLPCDSVVCALGFRPEYDKVDALAAVVDETYILGDCSKVGKVIDAIHSAYYAALRV